MNALTEQFVAESQDLVALATDALITIEREGQSVEQVSRVLRAFHTLKGSAALLDLPAMAVTMHAAEDLVIGIQSAHVPVGTEVVNLLLACLDGVTRWIGTIETTGELPLQAAEDARLMSDGLRRFLAPAKSTAVRQEADSHKDVPEWARDLMTSEADRTGQRRSGELFAVRYEPNAGCFFDGDDPLRLIRNIPVLLALRVETPLPSLNEADPFTCRLCFYAIAEGPLDALIAIFRLVPDQVQIVALPDVDDREPVRSKDNAAHAIIVGVLFEQKEMLRVTESDRARSVLGAAARAASNVLVHGGHAAAARDVADSAADEDALIAALDRAIHAIDAARPSPANDVAPMRNSARAENQDGAGSRSVKVPEARVDALVNLASELLVFNNGFSHLVSQAEAGGPPELMRQMRHQRDVIARLVAEMHRTVLELRMVTLAQVFRPLPRLVRDLSQQLGKKVELIVEGETVESDKAIVDRLFEPFLHIVRNAVDHGIEAPAARALAGKPEAGSIRIAAQRIGDQIAVEIADDGRGVDVAAVRLKALQNAMMPPAAIDALSDEEAFQLIFSSGFSTALNVTDVSGRGVGMDIVRKRVEQVGGRVTVASRSGAGTTIRLEMPASIAASRIMVVECAGQRFGIPMDSVTETVRLPTDRISAVKANEGFVLRDRVVPICSLAELMALPGPRASVDGVRLLIVIETGGKIVAVEVDAIRSRLEAVVKPLPGLLSTAPGYAGTTILGDGTVLLVLDVKDILP